MEYLVSPCRTIKSNLDKVPIVDGQWIIVTDTFQQFMDIGKSRIEINEIIILDTESQRVNLLTPINKFYFVKESGMLWFYSSGWIPLTVNSTGISFSPPSDIDPKINTVQKALEELFSTKISNCSEEVEDGSVVVFDSTAGNKIKSSVLTISSTGVISGVGTPEQDTDAATKKYVDDALNVNLNKALIYTIMLKATSDQPLSRTDSTELGQLRTDVVTLQYRW